jgi:hypothetical protein
MQGKIPMWGNPMREREREIYYYASGKFRTSSITLFSQEKYLLQNKNSPLQICLENRATVRTTV